MSSEYGELIGCRDMHFARVITDNEAAYLAGENRYLAPSAEITHESKTEINKRHYDNQLMFVTNVEGSTEVKNTVSGVPCKLAAELTGKPYDEAKGIFLDTGDSNEAPWYAYSGAMDLEGGARYFQYLKGKFAIGSEVARSKEDNITVNTVDLTYTPVVTSHKFEMPDGESKPLKAVKADTTDPAFTGADSWFAQVQTPETLGSPEALSMVSSTPAANATGVTLSTKPKLVFSNPISEESVVLIKNTDNSIVKLTKAYNDTNTELTLKTTSNLTAGASYTIIISGVKDIYGQELDTTVVSFTAAS